MESYLVVRLIPHKRLHFSFAPVLLVRFVCGSILCSHSCSVLPQKQELHARLATKKGPRFLECITGCTNAVDKPNDSQITYKFTPAAWHRAGCVRQGQLPVAVAPNLGENRVACPLHAFKLLCVNTFHTDRGLLLCLGFICVFISAVFPTCEPRTSDGTFCGFQKKA